MADRIELSIVLESKEKGTQSSEFNNQSKETEQDEQDKEQEKQKNRFLQMLEKNHDHLEAMVALVTIIGIGCTLFSIIAEFHKNIQASTFYGLNENYFSSESMENILVITFMNVFPKVVGILFPIASFYFHKIVKSSLKVDSEKNGVLFNNYIFPLFIFTILLSTYIDFIPMYISPKVEQLISRIPGFGQYGIWMLVAIPSYLVLILSILTIEELSEIYNFIIIVIAEACIGLIWLQFGGAKLEKTYMIYLLFTLYYFFSYWGLQYKESNAYICFTILLMLVITVVLLPPFWEVYKSSNSNLYSNKRNYEIVQKISNSNIDDTFNQQDITPKPQVVILHFGSEVLLMDFEIVDNKKIVDDKQVMDFIYSGKASSSTLNIVLDSFQIQEANQYYFYHCNFQDVKRKKNGAELE